jgi:tetratricopeptide (TPR) repeat protein
MLWIDEAAPRTLHSRAERALAVGATDRALGYYDEVASTVNEAWVGVGRCRAARIAGRLDRARTECASALARFPEDAGALFHSAQLARIGGDSKRALVLLERMATVAPQDRRSAPEIAALASSLGRSERAVEAAREMLRFDPGSLKARALLKRSAAGPR